MATLDTTEFNALCTGLKKMVIDECKVRGVTAEQIDNDDSVIAGRGALQLDSLDAVEIVGALDRHLGMALDSVGASKQAFKSFRVLSEHVAKSAEPARIQAFIAKYSS